METRLQANFQASSHTFTSSGGLRKVHDAYAQASALQDQTVEIV